MVSNLPVVLFKARILVLGLDRLDVGPWPRAAKSLALGPKSLLTSLQLAITG